MGLLASFIRGRRILLRNSAAHGDRLSDTVKQLLPHRLLLPLEAAAARLGREPELALLKHLVDPNLAALDIGASRGVYALALSYLCPQVIAFEPVPEIYELLCKSGIRRLRVEPVALSDKSGQATLTIPYVDGITRNSRASLEDVAQEDRYLARKVTVSTARLDDIELPPVGFAKIDVEGHELAVLRGGRAFVKQHKPNLILEIEQRFYSQSILEVFAEIRAWGYEGFFYSRRRLCRLDEFRVDRHQTNFLPNVLHPQYINNFIFCDVNKSVGARFASRFACQ